MVALLKYPPDYLKQERFYFPMARKTVNTEDFNAVSHSGLDQSLIEEVVENGDSGKYLGFASGEISESLVDQLMKTHTGSDKLPSNHGLDHVYIDADGYVVVIETKQFIGGAFQMNKATDNVPVQMSDAYIEYQIDKMRDYPETIETANVLAQAVLENRIRKVVAGVDRKNSNMVFVPLQ